ncbi:transcription antiterminator BglG [Flavonifractor sp. An92]|uniref:PRD domain-containing protein n=1 Tax=Flavonifractor sp. An92 TaxID=1965666 RepID=UPI000B374C4F|nr:MULTISPECIES: PRD domain-containing protein [unclassified Flavonifractor]OUN06387.1 transcription antiterminator BglG [Flavonifractor sp. An92]OUQ23706.1 transcription antiterminator BglG [Flavonifractor sp. An135]
MYRVTKVLNHNTVLAFDTEDHQEKLVLGKGVGFGRKVGERTTFSSEVTVYLLVQQGRGDPKDLVKRIDPVYLDVANGIVQAARSKFGEIDTSILLPLADHIAYAAERIRKNEPISNPLTADIQALFPEEYAVARVGHDLIREATGLDFSEDELGYIALHIHSSLDAMRVSQAMQMAALVRECVELVQRETGMTIDTASLSYNRLMTHIKYMAARILKGEKLSMDVNRFMRESYPRAFAIAAEICRHLGDSLKQTVDEGEIGYLAMHIERVFELQGHAPQAE